MSDQVSDNQSDDQTPANEDDGVDTIETMDAEQKCLQLEAELEAAKDRMLRMAAELENTRRRALKEKSEASQYALTGFARDLLSVADNFQRALEAAPAGDDTATAEVISGFVNGIRMTEKEMLTVFERHGVRLIKPENEPFDPNLHQAIAEVPGNGEPKGYVVDVAQTGFTIGDRVLRAAMVTVSTGANQSAGQ